MKTTTAISTTRYVTAHISPNTTPTTNAMPTTNATLTPSALSTSSTHLTSPSEIPSQTPSSPDIQTTSDNSPQEETTMGWWFPAHANKSDPSVRPPVKSTDNTSSLTTTTSMTTATSMTSTTSFHNSNTAPNDGGDGSTISPAMGFAIFVLVVLVLIGIVLFVVCLRRGKFKSWRQWGKCSHRWCWSYVKARTSSTTSHGPLTQDDSLSVDLPDPRHERELFSIGDRDGGEDGRRGSGARTRRGTEDDYFYDEIFERSAFVDERTNVSNKQLTLDDEDDEFDIPDLIFKGTHVKL